MTTTSDHRPRLWLPPTRPRLYSSSSGRARARRATDVLLLGTAVLALLVLVQVSDPPAGFELALIDLAESLPDTAHIVWRVAAGLLLAWTAVLLAASVVRRRPEILRDLVLSIVGAAVAVVLVEDLLLDGWSGGLWAALVATGPPATGASVRMAVVAGAIVVASPHVARPFRYLGRWILGLGAVALVVLGASTPTGVAIGLVCGAGSAALLHLALGSSGGLLGLGEVRRALGDLGVEAGQLSEVTRHPAGVLLVDALDGEGRTLLVKVYGRDAWDAQLLAKLWRALWYRDADALTLTRLQQAEHEAFITLLAARRGVPVSEVVQAGRTTGNDALIVLRPRGQVFPHQEPSPGPDVADRCWRSVLALHEAGIAHADLAPSQLRVDGDEVVLGGFGRASVSPSGDQIQVDRAQVLVATTLLVGPDRALASALANIGSEGLAWVLPYLQEAALGPELRSEVRAAGLDLDDLRQHAAAAAGTEEPRMARLRRVSPGTVLRAAVLLAAAYFLISSIAGIDFAQMVDELRTASWGLIVVALFLAQTPRFGQALAARGACPRRIPFGPVVLLQFAISFVNLVLPSTAARVAVNVRFFQRQGIPPASAMSVGVIDGLGGFAVQLIVLVSVLVFGLGDVDLSIEPPEGEIGSGNLVWVLGVLLVAVLAALVTAVAVPGLRRRILDRVRPWLSEVGETLATLRSPSRVAQVIGGNAIAEVLFVSTLAVVLAAFGESVPLGTLLVIDVCVALFAGLMPVPGGIGVSEGALIFGLTAAGVDEAVAFAATITYRMVTYYLPPIWGGVAFHRLEREGFL